MPDFMSLPRVAAAVALAVACAVVPAKAEDSPAEPANPVVAIVDGQPITKDDLNAAYFEIGSQLRGESSEQVFQSLVNFAIDIRLTEKAALDAGLDKDPGTAKRLEVARLHTLYAAYFQKAIDDAVTDEAIKKRYDEEMAKYDPTELHALHILVGSEDEAKAIIAELDKGGDFAALAKEKSIDTGSAKQGGDLGFFGHGAMIPEFEAAAFALKDGEYTKTPVKSQFGWHVIKAVERRQGTPPTLESETQRIKDELVGEAVNATRAALRVGVKIEYPLAKAGDDASVPPAADQPADPKN